MKRTRRGFHNGFDILVFVIIIFAVLALVLALTWDEPQPVRGVILRKQHRPQWTQLIMSGKVIVPIIHPEQWDIVVQADGTTDVEGQFLVTMPRNEWEDADIGDVWHRKDTVHE